MSKTVSLKSERVIRTKEEIELLDEAELPPISTVRFSRSLNTIEDLIQKIRSSLGEIERNHVKKDEEDDPVVELVLPNGAILGETPAVEKTGPRGQTQITEYKDIDLEHIDWDEHIDPDDYKGEKPQVRERYVYDDKSKMLAEKNEALQSKEELTVYEFPENEFEDVISAFVDQKAKQKTEEIINRLGLEDDEDIQDVRDVLRPVGKDNRLKPSEIRSVEFLFPEDL